jgi:hypothetical protein
MSDTPTDPAGTTPTPPPPLPPSDEELKHALTAFKKRLKLTRLDQESKLGGGRPTTTGKKSDIAGIIPPNQFPRAVWKELAARKQIKDVGGGFYTLP